MKTTKVSSLLEKPSKKKTTLSRGKEELLFSLPPKKKKPALFGRRSKGITKITKKKQTQGAFSFPKGRQ